MKRRVISLLMAVMLLVSLIGTSGITAFAAEAQQITEVYINIPSAPEAGQTVCDISQITVDPNAPYTIESAAWSAWIMDGGADLDITQPCVARGQYHLNVILAPKTGYAFADEVYQTANGMENGYNSLGDDGKLDVIFDWVIEPEYVGSVDVTVSGAAAGAATSAVAVTIPQNVNYTLQSAKWQVYDFAAQAYTDFTGTLAEGKLYRLTVQLGCDSAYSLYGTDAYINGEYADYETPSDTVMNVHYEVSLLDEIEEVNITGVTPAAAGKAPATTGITVPADAGYKLSSAVWYDDEGQLAQDAVFEEGKAYYLEMTLEADEGCGFTRDTRAYVDGEYAYSSGMDNVTTYSVTMRYSLKKQLEKVDITGVTEPVVGKAATLQGIKISDNGTVTYAQWQVYDPEYDYFEDIPEGTVFEDGKKYRLCINGESAEGMEYAEGAPVTVNGESVDNSYAYDTWVHAYAEYSFMKEIEKVDITGVTAPVVGKAATLQGIKVSDGSIITYAQWQVFDFESFEYQDIPEGTVFENGKKYRLCIDGKSAEGMEFAEDAPVTVNGADVDDSYANNQWMHAYAEYSFLKQITKVEIKATEPVAGQIPDYDVTVTAEGVDQDEIYVYWYDVGGNSYGAVSGAFAEKGLYEFYIDMCAEEGWEFAEDVSVTLNGKNILCYPYHYNMNLDLYSYYSIGYKQIDKVEINIAQPKVGQKAEDVEITVSKDAGYEIVYTYWAVSEDGEIENAESFEGTFEEGKYYFVEVVLEAPEDHVFDNDVKFLVNGEEVDPEYKGSQLIYCYAVHGPLTVKSTGSNPPTADTMLLMPMIALLVLSGTSLAVMSVLKKRAHR